METTFIRPDKLLSAYIDRYWFFNSTQSKVCTMPKIPPGVGMDLFLHHCDPFVTLEFGKMQQSHIIFSGQNSCQILPSGNINFIAVRFRAGAFKKFTDIPLHELLDSNASVEDIWGISGRQLFSRIIGLENKNAIADKLDNYFLKKLIPNDANTIAWDFVIDKFYREFDTLDISGLSNFMNVSVRHFRRKFAEETGFSPKQFQLLARFHATIKQLLLKKEKKYLSAALGNGYFDQTHFIKDFKSLMNCTPTRYLQNENFMSHFYYPSISR